MAIVKPTQDGQDRRLERIKAMKQTRKDLDELLGLKDSPAWAKLIQLLRRYAEYANREEKNANAEHDAGDLDAAQFSRLATRARQKQADFEFVADLLDKTQEQIDTVDANIKDLESQYKEAKEVLA
jgi:hypothetical protein